MEIQDVQTPPHLALARTTAPARALAIVLALLLAGCRTLPSAVAVSPIADAPERCPAKGDCATAKDEPSRDLAAARLWAQRATREQHQASASWLRCAGSATRAIVSPQPAIATEAAELSSRCTDRFLARVLRGQSPRWSPGATRIDGVDLSVEFRHLSGNFGGPATLARAEDVPVKLFGGQRHATPGFGVPLALLAPRCTDKPACKLFPPEGVFRPATAWIEPAQGSNAQSVRLVIADPLVVDSVVFGDRRYPLAADTSAFYARGARTSKLRRLAIWGLLGGNEVGRRAGLYLLEDYDPRKRPLVMIHGLGSSPLAWARLSNAVWGAPELRARFQVWHVVYQTNAPLLITRLRVQAYLDEAWRLLDPEGDDPARAGMVLVGHSLGGVVARMLCVDSGDVLWNAAFTVPPQALRGSLADLAGIESTFRFQPYPGVSRAIFLAAPHHGAPAADRWFGRLMHALVGRRAPEIQTLRTIARTQPEAVREALRAVYQHARLNSISTLQTTQPVRRAGQSLMPIAGIPYHTIAGRLPGRQPPTDGAVPLESALLPGAASTLIVPSGHDVYDNDEAVAEVLRILRQDLAEREVALP